MTATILKIETQEYYTPDAEWTYDIKKASYMAIEEARLIRIELSNRNDGYTYKLVLGEKL